MKHLVTGDPKFVKQWHEICDEHETKKNTWIKELRAVGFKAAHPNDGWVNREKNEIYFAYPYFNDGADIGDKVMISFSPDSTRPVRLIGSRCGLMLTYWKFEDIK